MRIILLGLVAICLIFVLPSHISAQEGSNTPVTGFRIISSQWEEGNDGQVKLRLQMVGYDSQDRPLEISDTSIAKVEVLVIRQGEGDGSTNVVSDGRVEFSVSKPVGRRYVLYLVNNRTRFNSQALDIKTALESIVRGFNSSDSQLIRVFNNTLSDSWSADSNIDNVVKNLENIPFPPDRMLGSCLSASLREAIQDFSKLLHTDPVSRGTIVLVSDGRNEKKQSDQTPCDQSWPIDALQSQPPIPVFPLLVITADGYGTPDDNLPNRVALQAIADESGGYFASDVHFSQLSQRADIIRGYLTNQVAMEVSLCVESGEYLVKLMLHVQGQKNPIQVDVPKPASILTGCAGLETSKPPTLTLTRLPDEEGATSLPLRLDWSKDVSVSRYSIVVNDLSDEKNSELYRNDQLSGTARNIEIPLKEISSGNSDTELKIEVMAYDENGSALIDSAAIWQGKLKALPVNISKLRVYPITSSNSDLELQFVVNDVREEIKAFTVVIQNTEQNNVNAPIFNKRFGPTDYQVLDEKEVSIKIPSIKLEQVKNDIDYSITVTALDSDGDVLDSQTSGTEVLKDISESSPPKVEQYISYPFIAAGVAIATVSIGAYMWLRHKRPRTPKPQLSAIRSVQIAQLALPEPRLRLDHDKTRTIERVVNATLVHTSTGEQIKIDGVPFRLGNQKRIQTINDAYLLGDQTVSDDQLIIDYRNGSFVLRNIGQNPIYVNNIALSSQGEAIVDTSPARLAIGRDTVLELRF